VLIDCDSCEVRNIACSDCVVSVLLGMPAPSAPVELDDAERAAIGVLARSGLVPPLRLVATTRNGTPEATGTYDGGHAGGGARAG
jgi:hypothetical protein